MVWSPTSNSVICANHFDQKFILNGIYPENVLSKPSSLPTLTGFRKFPKPRIYQPDQVDSFVEKDKIHNNEDETEKHCPSGYILIPSAVLKDFVAFGFATLFLQQYCCNNIRTGAETVLNTYCTNVLFTCSDHIVWGQNWANSIMTNIFYNNKQKIENSKIRKDVLSIFKKRQRSKC